jgi:hypothetical protein
MNYNHHFNNHVIDWYLWQAIHATTYVHKGTCVYRAIEYRFDPDDWSRYDGELL